MNLMTEMMKRCLSLGFALPVIFAALKRDHLEAVTVPQLIAEDPPSAGQLRAPGAGCGVRERAGSGS